MTGGYRTFAFCGKVRGMVSLNCILNYLPLPPEVISVGIGCEQNFGSLSAAELKNLQSRKIENRGKPGKHGI